MRRVQSVVWLFLLVSTLPLCQLIAQTGASPVRKLFGDSRAGIHPSDAATTATAVRGSYYHPDEMSGLDCTISIDWPAFFNAMKVNAAADRLKTLQGLNIRSQAVRGKSPTITFEWTGGTFPNKDQLEDGLRQTLGGFYQVYWSLIASSPIATAAEIAKIESLSDGGAKVYSSSKNTNVVITVDKENIPTHYTLETPVLNGTIDLHFVPSPQPVPGDLRRISSMDLSHRIGTTILNVKLALDYQAVGGFYVPRHVSYDIGGAYSLSMEFSGCSVSKGAPAEEVK